MLVTPISNDNTLPLDSDLIFEASIDFNERDTESIQVYVDGREVDVLIELKRIDLSRLLHLKLPLGLESGAEIVVEMAPTLNESSQILASFTLGDPLSDSTAVIDGLYFNVTDIFGGARSSCGYSDRSETEYIINGLELDQQWLYADFFINDKRHSILFEEQPEINELGHLHIEVSHQRDEETTLADQSRGIILYDRYGRAYSMSVSGGCQHIHDIRSRNNHSTMIIDESEDELACGFDQQLNLIDTGCDQSRNRQDFPFYLLILILILNLIYKKKWRE